MKAMTRLGLLCALCAPLFGAAADAATPEHRIYGEWRSGQIGGGGYVQQVHFSPTDAKRLYMTSDVGGLFRSDDLGKTWRMLHGALPPGGGTYEVRGLVVSPIDADHVVIACGSPWGAHKGIFITRDGGKTWRQTLTAMFPGNGDTRGNGKILVASPVDPRLLIAAADEGVFRSEDYGETWSAVNGPTNLFSPSDVMFDRSNPQRVWLCVSGWGKDKTVGLFISEDAGRTFRKLRDESPSEMLQDPADANVIYGFIHSRPHKSTDLGKSWQPIDRDLPKKAGARDDGTYAAIAATTDGDVIMGGHGGHFYRLDREAGTWQKIERKGVDEGSTWWGRMRPGMYNHFGSALGYLGTDPRDPKHWYFTDWYACYESVNAGENWTLRIDGVEMTVVHTVVPDLADPQLIHVGMADIGYFRSSDGGDVFSWNNNGISNNIKCISISSADPKRMYAVGPREWHWYANQVFSSSDGGESWKRPAMRGLPNMDDARCNTIVVNPKNPDEVYLTVSGGVKPGEGGVYRSTDAGDNWQWISEGMPSIGMFRTDIWVHGPELAASSDGSLVAISCNGNRLVTFDGARWTEVAKPSNNGGTNGIWADPSTPGRYYLAMKEGGLFRSNDAGKSWERLTAEATHWVGIDPRNPRNLATVSYTDIFASIDGGTTWNAIGEKLPYRHPRNVVAVGNGRVYVGTGGNGVFWANLPKAGPTAGASSLIQNGEMTDGTSQPAMWDTSSYKVGVYSLSRDTSVSRSAPASLQISTQGKATGFVHQRLEVGGGKSVNVRGFARVNGEFPTAQVAVQVFDSAWKQIDWKQLGQLSSGDDWREFGASFTVPNGAAHTLVGVSFEGNGRIWLDDVVAYGDGEAPAAPVAPASPSAPAAQAPNRPFDVPEAAPLPMRVPADNPAIRYVGRFDKRNPKMPRASWPGVSATLRFRGTDINATVEGGDNNRFQVIIDGVASKVFAARSRQTVRIATGLMDEPHTVQIMKITEPLFGNATFLGFELNEGASVLPPENAERAIEIIGDSISAGFGNESTSENDKFSHNTENAYLTYGALAAKRLGADVQIHAWSGKCMAPSNTLPAVYGRILPQEENSPMRDASAYKPQVIVINLGTNDFAGGNPEEQMWVKAYKEFVREIRRDNADATIFCVLGPMLSDEFSPSKSALSTCRRYLQRIVSETNAAGDGRVHFLEFPMQDGSNGFGAQWHPSRRTHQIMADHLVAAIEEKVGWSRTK